MMKTKAMILMLASGLMTTSASSETLSGALSQALARNPSLAAANANFQAIYSSQFVTMADMLPQVTAFARESRSNTDAENYADGTVNQAFNIGDRDVDSYGVMVTQDLFTSGKNINAFRSKRAEVRSERAKLTETEQQILLASITAYLNVLENQSVYDLNQQNVNVLTKQVEAVRDRFEVGVVTRTDIAQSEAALAGAQSALLSAQANLRGAKAIYREVIGVEAGELETVTKLPRLPRDLDDAINTARRENPTLIAAKEMSSSGRLNAYSAIGAALPSITLSGSYTRTEDPALTAIGVETEVTELVATLNVPLFRGGRAISGISAASSYSDALKYQVHASSDGVERGVIVAWNNYQASTSAVVAREQQIKASKIALEGVRQENQLGTRTNLDVLDAEQDLLDARVGLVRAGTSQNLAAYGVLASIGRLTSDRLRIDAADIGETE
jgi:outer membrane protein